MKCVCTQCHEPYVVDNSGDCLIIEHCTDMDRCSDCGCEGGWCCDSCGGNWVLNAGPPGDRCVCEKPYVEKDGDCVMPEDA